MKQGKSPQKGKEPRDSQSPGSGRGFARSPREVALLKGASGSCQRGLHSAASATLSVRIQPRASKNEIIRREGGGLKIRLTAPPVDGAANEALVRFLADTLRVSKSQVEIVSGHTSRDKIIKIKNISQENVERLLGSGSI